MSFNADYELIFKYMKNEIEGHGDDNEDREDHENPTNEIVGGADDWDKYLQFDYELTNEDTEFYNKSNNDLFVPKLVKIKYDIEQKQIAGKTEKSKPKTKKHKTEEPKPEEPEQTEKTETKPEEPKQTETKPEDSKTEQTETKTEKLEQTEQTESKTEKLEQPKTEQTETKTEEPKTEQTGGVKTKKQTKPKKRSIKNIYNRKSNEQVMKGGKSANEILDGLDA